MDKDTGHSVTVTHFINPHLFWYRRIDAASRDEYIYALADLERKLQELYRNKPLMETRCRPQVGDKVAVNFVPLNKFIRAEVLQTAEFKEEEFIVWTTDYGFPLMTKKEHVRRLPEPFQSTPRSQVYCGGVSNVQPAEVEYDHIESNLVMVKQEQWLQKACEMLQKLLADAVSIKFNKKFITDGYHNWGDLVVENHKGHRFNAREYLQMAKYAMEVGEEFPRMCPKYKTTKIAPWLTNNRKNNMKYNTIKNNIVEHSKQMNSALIDEFAKRKVEDWCARNERQQEYHHISDVQHMESGCESLQDLSLDDITFDDSVSVMAMKQKHSKYHSQNVDKCIAEEPINYIGKAGALTKLKQQKYASSNNLPPQAQIQNFDIILNENSSAPAAASAALVSLNSSSSTSVSSRMQRLAELRSKQARNNSQSNSQNLLISDSDTTISSKTAESSVSLRLQKMTELRKKSAQLEKQRQAKEPDSKLIESPKSLDLNDSIDSNTSSNEGNKSIGSSRIQKMIELRRKCIQSDKMRTTNEGKGAIPKNQKNFIDSLTSVESHSTNIGDSFPYQNLTGNDSILDQSQESKTELMAKHNRAKQLSALRSKVKQRSENTDSGPNKVESTLATTSSKYMENLKKIREQNPSLQDEDNIHNIDIFSFKLKPKTQIATISSSPKDEPKLPPLNGSKDKAEETQAAYDGLTLVPAGFDITRLQNYRDEKNHWHRKKTTRYDHVPHDNSSCEEILCNRNDKSSSSSDFFQIKPRNQNHQSTPRSGLSERLKRHSYNKKSSDNFHHLKEDQNLLDMSGPSLDDTSLVQPFKFGPLASKISTSQSSTSNISKPQIRKHHRELKSPTLQISKIDEILKHHSFDSELDENNKNIFDFKHILPMNKPKPHKPSDKNEAVSSNTGTANPSIINMVGDILPTNTEDKFCNEKHLKNVSNYTTLMEVKHSEQLPIIEGEINMQTKFIDHLVLAHSSIPLLPIENVTEASFLPEIHEEMRNMRINKVYRIQVYSWTHLLRGNSLFVVNPSRTGKTWSYLPALCSLVCYRNNTLRPSYGPIALVLVASSRHVESLNGYSRRLMGGFRTDAPVCVPSYGMRNFIDTKIQLLNGCGILITTPSSLLRLLKDNEREPLFDWERLQQIAIDDLDLMLSRSPEDFQTAMRIVFKMTKKSIYKTLRPQLMVTSRDWDGVMIRLLRKSNQPLLLIGDFLEAAVYGRATISVKLKSSQEKMVSIERFLRKQSQSLQGDVLAQKRFLIMCNGDEDVEKVVGFLTEGGFSNLAYYDRSTESEKTTVNEWKKKISSQILICTDARLPELQIQNVHNLIHFSMPTSWTQFTTRFSALAQTYENLVCKNFEQSKMAISNQHGNQTILPPHSMILLDEENSLQLPRLVDFMRKHNQQVHPDILAVSKRVLVMREEARIFKGALLCPQLLEFGECDEARCDNRHELTRYDIIEENEDIPNTGELRIHILKVFSPTHYSARLLTHKANNSPSSQWNEVRRSKEALAFTMQFDMHYRNENNLALHWPPHINDLCIYKYADNFRRALILDAPSFAGKNVNVVQSKLRVKLRLIDEGSVVNDVKCSEIFMCHEKFKDFPAQAVDIRLMDVVPFDNERTWDSKTTKQVQKWIMDEIKGNHVIHVGINFALANTIWVKNVVVLEELTTLGAYRQYVNLKMSLIQKNFAMLYKGERKNVRDIAAEYGLLKFTSSQEAETEDVCDDDYQSCKNESLDLIKFSSSNGGEESSPNTSMQSARNNGDINESIKRKESRNGNDKEQLMENKLKAGNVYEEEENWDNLSVESDGQRNEVFVPLKKSETLVDNHSSPDCSATNSSPPEQQESWANLCLNDVTKVEIGDEGENGNWENIFLQIIDRKHMQLFDDLVELINKHVENIKSNIEDQKRIYDFEPLQNCIVKYNKIYLRAKVHGVFGANVKERLYRFFLCDYACFTNVKSRDLYNDCFYETTEEIVKFTPYQSVHCTLAGIQWDRFNKRYQVTKEYLYACAVEERNDEEKKALNLYNLPVRSYRILLFECEKDGEFSSAEMFNRTLLDVGITTTDEKTKFYLDYKLDLGTSDGGKPKEEENIEEINCNNSSSGDEVYTFEQFLTCIEKAQEMDDVENSLLEETTKPLRDFKIPADEENSKVSPVVEVNKASTSGNRKCYKTEIEDEEEEDHCTSDSDSNNKKSSSPSLTSSNETSSDKIDVVPPLKALNRRPSTTWYDTDCILILSIYAPDIKEYQLKIQQKTLYFSTQMEKEDYVLNLNLLGSIDPQSVSHEIKGLNVVVRLIKLVFMKWPRLLEEPTKYSWMKYNFNCYDSQEMDGISSHQRLQEILEKSPRLNESQLYEELDSEDSERDKYETYNRIDNNDDCNDPFS